MRIAIGADHAGFPLKEQVRAALERKGHEVADYGTDSQQSTDYPDYAARVAREVAAGRADRGVLVCFTGVGMSMAANKIPGARAALGTSVEQVRLVRQHNDANILTLGGKFIDAATAEALLDTFLDTEFEGGRHSRRVAKIALLEGQAEASRAPVSAAEPMARSLAEVDPEVWEAVRNEVLRQHTGLELIASENFTSEAVLEATASVFTNKYAEGYPGRRYYGGCQHVDVVESLARERVKKIFGAEHANVQPHSGSQANMAAYAAVLQPGDTMLGMNLSHGGHLTHGHHLNFSGKTYKVIPYGVRREDETIDYDELRKLALEHRPKLIIAGGSAYPRILDCQRFREIADEAGAVLLVDMAHFAGLVAAGLHPNPCEYAAIVTPTTVKTPPRPRSGLILCREKYAAAVDKVVFPGVQGGPLVHVIAAKAVCFWEAMQPEFLAYQRQVVANAQALAHGLARGGLRVVSGGTDTHLLLVDVFSKGIRGREAEATLDQAHITVNKNTIPFDVNPPLNPSGIRLGSPAVTTRGFREPEMLEVAEMIAEVLNNLPSEETRQAVRARVAALVERFPLYRWKLNRAAK